MTHNNDPALLWLPPYTHVPGITPHPISHSYGHTEDSDRWTNAEHLFRGRYLFDRGFYWEAHEAWEQLWIQLGRNGVNADIVKGLIKLSACGVKCLEGNEAGALRHGKRAAELLRNDFEASWFPAEELELFKRLCKGAAECPPVLERPATGEAKVIF